MEAPTVLRTGELEIRPSEFVALVDGKPLGLTVRELQLLTALVERRDRIVSREELYSVVWGEPYRKSDRSVDVYVGKLRQKLAQALPGRSSHPHALRVRLSLHISFTRRRHPRNRLGAGPVTASSPYMTELKERNPMRKLLAFAVCATLALGAAACGSDDDDDDGGGGGGGGGDLSGTIRIDGSSTVGPFAQAAQEAFQGENPGVRITVAQSGTGGGFEKFCAGETDISNASRPIDEEEEVPLCEKEGVDYTEVQVANDGISVATNPELAVDCMTTQQLKQLWQQGSKINSLSEIDPSLPDGELSLFGPGTDSGTFEFFTEEINGEEGNSRKDYQPSEDDNVLVQGVAGESGGLGYFGFSYYEQNQDKLGLVSVDAGDGCIEPSLETISSGEYKPLSRPLFMYPSAEAMQRPEVKAFMDYVVENYQAISEASAIVPMSQEQADQAKSALGS